MNKVSSVIKALRKINPETINVYDTNYQSPFFDYIIVATVDSVRQANNSISYLKEYLTEDGYKVKSASGLDSGWVLVDGYDILIHVFTTSEHERVDIEKLYLEYNKVDLKEFE